MHNLSAVVAGLSRSKNGVLSHAYDPAIHEAVPPRRQYCFAWRTSSWMRGSSPRMTLSVGHAPSSRGFRFTCQTATPSPFEQPLRASAGKPMLRRPYSLSRPRAGPSSLCLSPLRMRGDGAPGGAAVNRFNIRISLRRCGSASRRATRTVLCPGSFAAVFFRFAQCRKRNCCAGPRFAFSRLWLAAPSPRSPAPCE